MNAQIISLGGAPVPSKAAYRALWDLYDRLKIRTLERYLNAMAAWLGGYGKKYSPSPSWELLIQMLEAAKLYE